MTAHRCPDDETIAAYFDGLLSAVDEESLYTEMRTCSDCLEVLASVGVVVREAPLVPSGFTVPEAVTQSAVALFDRFVERESLVTVAVRWVQDALMPLADALQPTMAPALSMRGASTHLGRFEELKFHVTLGDVALEIDLEVDGPEEVALTVTPTKAPPSGLLFRLAADGETRAVSSLSAIGSTVSALPPGGYELVLEQGERALGKMTLELHR
jgi:hypothetical protein